MRDPPTLKGQHFSPNPLKIGKISPNPPIPPLVSTLFSQLAQVHVVFLEPDVNNFHTADGRQTEEREGPLSYQIVCTNSFDRRWD